MRRQSTFNSNAAEEILLTEQGLGDSSSDEGNDLKSKKATKCSC